MKIGIIGATGKQGNLLVLEALERGHEVTALIRDHAKLIQDIPYIEKELYDLAPDEMEQFDAVINASNAPDHMPQLHQTALRHITKILKDMPTRLYIVGGAGSLFTDQSKTMTLAESPNFPEGFKATANSMAAALVELKSTKGTNWTYVSPAADFIFEGEKTGHYQLAGDILTLNSEGNSVISYADYAIGMIDLVESGEHNQERVSLVSK